MLYWILTNHKNWSPMKNSDSKGLVFRTRSSIYKCSNKIDKQQYNVNTSNKYSQFTVNVNIETHDIQIN
jgi:hypothetical protein